MDRCNSLEGATTTTEQTPVILVPEVVQRREDMSPDGILRLHLQADGDVVLYVSGRSASGYDKTKSVSIEFCSNSGGGKSPRTLEALKALMAAMAADNEAPPTGLRDYQPKAHYFRREASGG
jgi:hypothetical protein